MNVRVELINESRAQLDIVDNGQRFDPDGMVIGAFIRDAQRNGPGTRLIRQIAGGSGRGVR